MQRSALCRSLRELSNAYLLAKIGVDTAENEPLEVWGENSIQYSLHSYAARGIAASSEGGDYIGALCAPSWACMLSRESTRSPGSAHASLRNEKARSVFLRHVSLLVEFSFYLVFLLVFFIFFSFSLVSFVVFLFARTCLRENLVENERRKIYTENITLGAFFLGTCLKRTPKRPTLLPHDQTRHCAWSCAPHARIRN